MPYIGVNTIIPGEQKFYNAENFDLFFDTTVDYQSDGAELPIIFQTADSETAILSPVGIKTSFIMIYTAKLDINNFSIDYIYNIVNSDNDNQAVLIVKEETILSARTGSSTGSWEGNLLKGDTIKMVYFIHAATSETKFSLITNTNTTISIGEGYTAEVARKIRNIYVGVETETSIHNEKKEVARKIIRGYIGVEGVARRFFKLEVMSYTGNYVVTDVTIDTKLYKLYTLTSSGILTTNKSGEYWMCNGGSGGGNSKVELTSSSATCDNGLGGGGGPIKEGPLAPGKYLVTIGAGGINKTIGGSTSIGNISTSTPDKYYQGASGGGNTTHYFPTELGLFYTNGGIGSNETTIPFSGKTIVGFNNFKHSAGGSGGTLYITLNQLETYLGGEGGSNGSNGGTASQALEVMLDSIPGGDYGGGANGNLNSINGNDATFYGSGGGAASLYYNNSADYFTGVGGNGYQGVVYLLIAA